MPSINQEYGVRKLRGKEREGGWEEGKKKSTERDPILRCFCFTTRNRKCSTLWELKYLKKKDSVERRHIPRDLFIKESLYLKFKADKKKNCHTNNI